ncbi:MAG TPA: TonB-dependent receptor [Parasulfuritortus sp.]
MTRQWALRQSTFFILAAIAGTAWGQDESYTLGDVVVSAPRLDASLLNTTAVDGQKLDSLRYTTSDTASLLRDVPGLSLFGAGGVSSLPTVHGLADDRLRVQVDGMDLIAACPNHMNSPLSYIDPTSVASAKVFAGITPVSAGGDSIGGTIQVESAPPVFAPAGAGSQVSGEAGVFFRSNGNVRGGNVSATLAKEDFSLTYAGSTVEADDYKAADNFKAAGASSGRGWLEGDVVGSSAYKSQNQSLGMAFRRDNQLFEMKVGVQNIPYEGYPTQRMDMTGNDSTQINLAYTGQYQWGILKARVYDEKTEHKMDFGNDKQYWYPSYATCAAYNFVPGMGTCAAGMPMDTKGHNTGAKLSADIDLSRRDALKVGGEYQRYRLSDWWSPSGMNMWPNTFWNINNGQRDRVALFAEWNARWSQKWHSQLGVRNETVSMDTGNVQGYSASYSTDANAFNSQNHSITDHNWDLTALARYIPAATQTYEFGLAQKTRSPNLYERYTWSTGGMAMVMNNFAGDGNGYVGNLNLSPETAYTLSATADWHDAGKERWGMKVTPYWTYVDGYIDAQRIAGSNTATTGFVQLRYANQSARLYGIDVSGHLPLADATGYGSFTATGNLGYVRGKNMTTGDNLYNIMPLNARFAVVQRLNSWTNSVELQLVAGKKDVSQTRNELQTGGYGLVNLRSSYAWKHMRLDVGVENLFDKFYNAPLGGAYVGQGKTMSILGVPWGVAVPGPGRSFYTALSGKF